MKFFIVLGLLPLFSAMPYTPGQYNIDNDYENGNEWAFQPWNTSYFFNPTDSSFSFAPFNSTSFGSGSFDPLGLFPSLSSDSNLGFQTRAMSATLQAALRALSFNPNAAEIFETIFADESICLNNVEELIQATEEGTKLVELAEGDLLNLKSRMESMIALGEDGDEEAVVREVAAILRALDPLVKKIEPSTITVCNGSPDSVVSSLLSLTNVIDQLAKEPEVDPEVRQTFSQFSEVVSKVTSLVGQLRDQTKEFQNFCAGDKESSAQAIKSLGDIIRNLADMTSQLGDNEQSAEAIEKGNKLVDNIATQLQQMKDIDVGDLDCSATDLNGAAASMEDLANIIQEVGIETLKLQLGVEF